MQTVPKNKKPVKLPNELAQDEFVCAFGALNEHSEWVAARTLHTAIGEINKMARLRLTPYFTNT